MFCLTDILGMYTIHLPDPLKRLLLEYSGHLRVGRMSVQWTVFQ